MPYLYLVSSLDLSHRHYRVPPSTTAEAWLESKVHFAFESQFVVKLIAALSPSPTGVSLVCTVLNTIRPVILFPFDSIRACGLVCSSFCARFVQLMEYEPGGDLAGLMQRLDPFLLPLAAVCSAMEQLLRGLCYLHTREIVHQCARALL